MNEHIPGHTGKKIIRTKEMALYIAKYNHFGKQMRAYSCVAETGTIHWHVTRMSKGLFYTSQRKDPRRSRRAANIPK